MMLQRRGWMWTSLALALIIGASAGVIADRLASDRPAPQERGSGGSGFVWFTCDGRDIEADPVYPYRPEHRDYLVRRLRKRLDLGAAQVSELETMLEEKRDAARRYWTETRDSYCHMQHSFRMDIRELLTPEQAQTYDELLRRVDAHHLERLEAQSPDGEQPGTGDP
jgi:hypothetical protein